MKRFFLLMIPLAILATMSFSCEEGGDEPVPGPGTETTATLSVSPTTLSFDTYESSTQVLDVKSSGKWTASVGNGGSWCQLDTRSGDGDGSVHVTAVANTSTSPRNTTITFTGAGNTSATVDVSQIAAPVNPVQTVTTTLSADPKTWDGVKRADITYQLLAYSFADSGSDGWGDLKGIDAHLDYIDGLGASAIWLSPIQTAGSYHGYDVNDYSSIDSHYGSESDFQTLINDARGKGIDIYMDYVLNHSGNGTQWFLDALSDPAGSPYKDYYVISDTKSYTHPSFGGAGNNGGMGGWIEINGYHGRLHFRLDWSGSDKYVTVSKSDAAAESSNASASKWLWIGSIGAVGLYETSPNIFEITLDVSTSWGFLVKTDPSGDVWGSAKWGAPSGAGNIAFDTPFKIISGDSAGNITFANTGYSYFASFDQSMPDLNYGPYASASSSDTFKALAASADKWVNMGVNGLRLDAVIWIYQKQTDANVSFLKQWYDRINATYKARGGSGDIYMVGESWTDSFEQMVPYYKGLPSNFNFWYWWTLRDAIKNGTANTLASTMKSWRASILAKRSGAIDAIKMTNHDEDRAASELGKSVEKEKLAACVLLTSPGKPYIYQGEELGYWGTKSGGDEYVRQPIKWTRTGSVPTTALGGKVDNSMLTADISVEAQSASAGSLLNVYKTFGRLRNSYVSLASGEITEHSKYGSSSSAKSIAAWYRTSGSEKTLVVHNFASNAVTISFEAEDLGKCIGLNGTASLKTTTNNGVLTDNTLTLGGYSSAVFLISE